MNANGARPVCLRSLGEKGLRFSADNNMLVMLIMGAITMMMMMRHPTHLEFRGVREVDH